MRLNSILGIILITGHYILYGTTTPFIKPDKPKLVGTATIKIKDEGRFYQIILPDRQTFTLPKYIDGK